MNKTDSDRWIGKLILIVLVIIFGLVIPITQILATASIGEADIERQINLYERFYWAILVIVSVALIFEISRKNNKYGDGDGFYSMGQKPSIEYFKNFSGIQIAMLSFIIMPALFMVASFFKLGGFTGLRVLPVQQFTPGQSLFFTTLLTPISENIFFAGVIAFILLVGNILATKYKPNYKEYQLYIYSAVVTIGGLLAVYWHKYAYQGSDTALFVVALFWGIGGIITLATGNFIPFLAMHMSNNFFIDFQRLYSSDALFISMGALIVVLSTVYYTKYKGNLLGKYKTKKNIL